MPFAPQYNPTKDFSQDEAVNATGRSMVNTTALDAEFANISASANQINENLQVIQRDDNELRDYLIKPRMLSDATRALIGGGWNPRGIWQPGVTYAVRDFVEHNAMCYVCALAHTSNTFPAEVSFWLGVSSVADVVALTERAETAAGQAAASAVAANSSADTAATSATNAANSAASITGSVTAAANSALLAEQHRTAAATSASNAANSASQSDAAKTAAQNAAQTAATTAATQTSAQITQDMQGYVNSASTSATQSANSATQAAAARDAAQAAATSVNPSELVHKSGNETISGLKTFTTPPAGVLIPGQLVAMFSDAPPTGTLACNGGAISRTLYANLFTAIGTKYGAGDGTNTFNVPNFLQDFAVLAAGSLSVGSTTVGSVISHNHSAWMDIQGSHYHTLGGNWAGAKNNGGGPAGSSDLGTAAGQNTDWSGKHAHTIGVGTTGGTYNLAGGLRLLICIAF